MKSDNKYMLASDYDGTLCIYGAVSRENIEAIGELRKKGDLFVISTGRDYFDAYYFFKVNHSFEYDFLIMNNGAQACDSRGNCIFEAAVCEGKLFSKELIKRCIELTRDECIVSFEKDHVIFNVENIKNEKLNELNNINEFVAMHLKCENGREAKRVSETLNREYGKFINAACNGRCIDIIKEGISKTHGIIKLADHLGVAKNNIWTVGDNYNDVDMVKAFHGCAMLGSPDEVINAAEFVCKSVADAIALMSVYARDI